MKLFTLSYAVASFSLLVSCSSSNSTANANLQGQAVAIRQPADEPTPKVLTPAPKAHETIVREHNNKLLSEEKVQMNGKTFLVQRFILTEEPLETHVETTELPTE
jgi:hypothetical protein